MTTTLPTMRWRAKITGRARGGFLTRATPTTSRLRQRWNFYGTHAGELTKPDLEKVTELLLLGNKLTDVKDLEKLTQLKELGLRNNSDLTKAQIDELQKALPN